MDADCRGHAGAGGRGEEEEEGSTFHLSRVVVNKQNDIRDEVNRQRCELLSLDTTGCGDFIDNDDIATSEGSRLHLGTYTNVRTNMA